MRFHAFIQDGDIFEKELWFVRTTRTPTSLKQSIVFDRFRRINLPFQKYLTILWFECFFTFFWVTQKIDDWIKLFKTRYDIGYEWRNIGVFLKKVAISKEVNTWGCIVVLLGENIYLRRLPPCSMAPYLLIQRCSRWRLRRVSPMGRTCSMAVTHMSARLWPLLLKCSPTGCDKTGLVT